MTLNGSRPACSANNIKTKTSVRICYHLLMGRVQNFLRPSIRRIIFALIIWLVLWLVSYFFTAKCFLADCISDGQMTSCCSSLENKIAELFYTIKLSFPVIAYLLSCKLTK